MSKVVIFDLKSGGIWWEQQLQLGAYSQAMRYPNGLLPRLDGACLLQVNAKGVTPTWLSQPRLEAVAGLFEAVKRLFDDQQTHGQVKITDTYQLFTEGEVKAYPRVTAILKAVLNKPALNGYLVKQAVSFTLEELVAKKLPPAELLSRFQSGLFNPLAGSTAHMESRGEEGRTLHKCVEGWLVGNPPTIAPENEWLTKAYHHFLSFAERHHLKLFEDWAEVKVWSPTLGFGGTLDFVATLEPCSQKCCEPWRIHGVA